MKEKRKFKFHNYKASFDKRANHGNNHPSSKTSFKSEDHDNDNNEVNGDIEDKEGDDGGNEHEVSKASIPLEEVKAHPEYVNRVEFAGKYKYIRVICIDAFWYFSI